MNSGDNYTVTLRPQGAWFAEILDTDGTIRPAKCCEGGSWIKNTFTNGFKDQVLAAMGINTSGAGTLSPSLVSILYVNPCNYNGSATPSLMQVGTSTTAAAATQTCLQSYVKTATGFYPIGNSVTANSNGNIVAVSKQIFTAEAGTQTYNEACVTICNYSQGQTGLYSAPSASGTTPANYFMANRVVFTSGVVLTAGQQLILTFAATIPTIYNNPQTITLTTQNGYNLSGQLALVGTLQNIIGGTVSTAGVWTDVDYMPGCLLPLASGITNATSGKFVLTGHNSIITAGTNGTNMWSGVTNSITAQAATSTSASDYSPGSFTTAPYTTGVGGVYNGSGNFNRSVLGYWAVGNPASTTTYNSLMIGNNSGVQAGWQLLFTTPQSFNNTTAVTFGLNFAIA